MKFFLIIFIAVILNADVNKFSKILEENKKTYNVYYDYGPFKSSKISKKITSSKKIMKRDEYQLQAIFNDSVKINNKWYVSKIDGYDIKIKDTKVFLQKKNEVIKLEIKSIF